MKNTDKKQLIIKGETYTFFYAFEGGEYYTKDNAKADEPYVALMDDGKLQILYNGVHCPYDIAYEVVEPQKESDEEIAKRELNQAIYEVLSNKYKKDCPEAHKAVEAAGYEIEKWNGVFHVRNRATEKCICISRRGMISFNCYRRDVKINDHFDFVACLNKPLNKTYWQMRQAEDWYESNARRSYEMLRRAKWGVRYHADSISDAERELEKAFEKYESSIQYHTKAQKASAEALTKLRKELGLAS